MNVPLNPEVRARLDAHLDAVEKALVEAKCTRERRRGIVDDLEAQIVEMLEKRSSTPTIGDLEAILATLDPPAAYGETGGTQAGPAAAPESRGSFTAGAAAPGSPFGPGGSMGAARPFSTRKPRLSRMALAGFICIVGSLVCTVLLGAMFWAFAATHAVQRTTVNVPAVVIPPNGPEQTATAVPGYTVVNEPSAGGKLLPVACVTVAPGALALIGTILGWMAFAAIRRSDGTLYGRTLALFDGLFYPLPCALLLFILLPAHMILLTLLVGGIFLAIFLLRLITARHTPVATAPPPQGPLP